MKNTILMIIFAFLIGILLLSPIYAEIATKQEALTIANNWITTIIHHNSNWGGYEKAAVQEIQEFKHEGRTIGYFCSVMPKGYIIVSILKELAPVKAYSATCNLDPDIDEGLTDFLKIKMVRILNSIERQLGPIQSVKNKELEDILEICYRSVWDEFEVPCEVFYEHLGTSSILADYNEGQQLLTSDWNQNNPYNLYCPAPPGGDDCTRSNCSVGCVATAAGQIMHHWNWPPFGQGGSPYSDTYGWLFIPDTCTSFSATEQKDATAELCSEVGQACLMDYCVSSTGSGCGSSATHPDMIDAYINNFRYSDDCSSVPRNIFSANNWFGIMQDQFEWNQPVQYGIPGHSLISDGWKIVASEKQYHMNYGWAGWVDTLDAEWDPYSNSNTWYTLDELPGGDTLGEDMILNIYPITAIGGSFSGTYNRDASFIYRYFTHDATCATDASFGIGQRLQFLPRVEVKCQSTTGYVQFNGSAVSGFDNWLYSINNEDQKVGIRIYDGSVRLCENGGIRFHGQYP